MPWIEIKCWWKYLLSSRKRLDCFSFLYKNEVKELWYLRHKAIVHLRICFYLLLPRSSSIISGTGSPILENFKLINENVFDWYDIHSSRKVIQVLFIAFWLNEFKQSESFLFSLKGTAKKKLFFKKNNALLMRLLWPSPQRIQFLIFKPLSYCFEETKGFDVKASFASRPVSRLISWYNNQVM